MLGFLTVVRHPANSRSYERVWRLLTETVASLLAQRDGNIRLVVVCNRALRLPDDPRIDLVEVDWPPVAHLRTAAEWGVPAQHLDKGTKMTVGLGRLRDAGCQHVMIVDADDYVANDVSAFVNPRSDANGWFVDKGFLLTPRGLLPLEGFNHLCGSSHIVRFDLLEAAVPAGLDHSWPQDLVIEATDPDFLVRVLGNHQDTADILAAGGSPLEPFPSRAVVWQLATGENFSDATHQSRGWMLRQDRQTGLDPAVQERFSIPDGKVAGGAAHTRRRRLRTRVERSRLRIGEAIRPRSGARPGSEVQILLTPREDQVAELALCLESVARHLEQPVERVSVVSPPGTELATWALPGVDQVLCQQDFLGEEILQEIAALTPAYDRDAIANRLIRLSLDRVDGCDAILAGDVDFVMLRDLRFNEGDRDVWFAGDPPQQHHADLLRRLLPGAASPSLGPAPAPFIYRRRAVEELQNALVEGRPGARWQTVLLEALDPAEPEPLDERLLYAGFVSVGGSQAVRWCRALLVVSQLEAGADLDDAERLWAERYRFLRTSDQAAGRPS